MTIEHCKQNFFLILNNRIKANHLLLWLKLYRTEPVGDQCW
jgi:hypothetical protein